MKWFFASASRETAALSVPAKAYLYRLCLSLCFLVIISYLLISDSARPGVFVIALLDLVFCADILFRNAKSDLGHLQVSFSVLVACSVLAAFGYSLAQTFFVRPLAGGLTDLYVPFVLLISFYLWHTLGLARSKERTFVFIKKLHDFLPKSGCLLEEGKEKRIFATELVKDNLIKVNAGERIPCDGVLEGGETIIDESLITGNILPAHKNTGALVYAGTLNKGQEITVRVEKPLSQSAIAGIIDSLSSSEQDRCVEKDPLDSYSKWVLTVAVCAAVACYIYFYAQGGYVRPFHNIGFFLLAIGLGCPLAFLFSVRLPSYFVRQGAAKKGVQLQVLTALEQLHRAHTVFFDKTGTLTQGQLHIASVHGIGDKNIHDLLLGLITAEQQVESPLAQAVKEYATEQHIKPLALKSFEIYPGRGVQAITEKDAYSVGLPSWFKELDIKIPQEINSEQLIICIAKEQRYLGYVVVEDCVRAGAISTVEILKKLGKEVVLLSGDTEASVRAVAQECGIEQVNFSVLPQTKAEIVGNYKALGKTTVMVGDGFNDIVALLRADASVVFSSGKNVYNNWVDVVLHRADLSAVTDLLVMYGRWIGCVRGNVVLSIVCNLLILAAILFAPVPTAKLITVLLSGMLVSILIVLLNSMRLLHIK